MTEIKLGVAVLNRGKKLNDFSKFVINNKEMKNIKPFENLFRKSNILKYFINLLNFLFFLFHLNLNL